VTKPKITVDPRIVRLLKVVAYDLDSGVPCGRTTGHGENCQLGSECDGCAARKKATQTLDAIIRGEADV
jgi:hypothetical protein